MKFRPGTEDGDYQVKLRNLIRFLEHGDKAKVTLRYRGREMAHQELESIYSSASKKISKSWVRLSNFQRWKVVN